MPDYTQLETVATEHARRVGSPGFIATPGERTYNIYPEGLGGRVEEYWPTQTGGQPDLRSISIYGQPEGVGEGGIDIENLPQQDYELGRLTIKRQYSDDVKIADAYQQGSPQYMALHDEARMVMQSRLSKLQMNLDRAEMAFKQVRQDPNLSPDEQFIGKTKFYEANPVWETPRPKYPKPLTPQEQMMAKISGGLEEETPTGKIVSPAVGQVGIPAPQSTGTITAKPNRASLLLEYKRLGGSKTKEGRTFADKYLR